MSTRTQSAPARAPGFTYRQNALHCESVSVADAAKRYGSPLYVYSATTIQDRFRKFDQAFSRHSHAVCYSVKANSNLSILRMLATLGAGFDVVSGGELERVLAAAPESASRVVFSGVGKTADEMDLALRSGILLFNLESEGELRALAQRAARMRKTARVSFRVNPDVHAVTHPYITTGLREHKFGVPIRQARRLYAEAAQFDWLEPAGISVHIGSQITDVAPFREAMERVVTLAEQLMRDGLNIGYIDAGGGLGIPYDGSHRNHFEASVRDYAKAVLGPLSGSSFHLLLEPGRIIVAPAGALITRVLYIKQNARKRFIVVDAGMNYLIRPSLYGAYHEIVPVVRKRSKTTKADVVGPVCESGDFFAKNRELPELEEGDLVAILDAGAYGMSISSNYNTRPRPAEVLVNGNQARLIRHREKVTSLFSEEQI